MITYNDILDFVTDGKFVNPEKVTAIEIYGFENAKKMWENGEPDFTTREYLMTISCQNALLGKSLNNDPEYKTL